ncbi:Glycoside Hydrolase Family 6 protein [Tuber magnatum]|uniref:Glycoside Hydrolase Family 6 protein n=1 Tax=Tuber magnatum TaxID=42249 RepID=A0A317SS89_9PEZI|nr:Glycoside Hydrolase Family 6 protein [Tuber magnatum]
MCSPASLLSAGLLLSLSPLQALVYGNLVCCGVGFANLGYAQKLDGVIASFLAEGDAVNSARRKAAQEVSTFVWITAFGDAGSTHRELTLGDGRMKKYRQFIDRIAAAINGPPYGRLGFAVILEPDSLRSLIAHLGSKLQQKNFALYIDATHSNWLGWPGNLDSWRYPHLEAKGLPAQFIVDQGRSGSQNIRDNGGHWCSIKETGYVRCTPYSLPHSRGVLTLLFTKRFGIRPSTQTGDCNIDSLGRAWPGHESDGTASGFDPNCVSSDAHIPAPEAGAWFNDFAKVLVKNASPPLEGI